MQHDPIHLPDTPPGVAENAIGSLIGVAGNLDARFLPVGEALLKLVETVDSVAQGLAEVRAAFAGSEAGEAIVQLSRATDCLRATPAQQAHRRESFGRLKSRVVALRGLSAELDRVLHVLEFYGLNIKIAAGGEAEFVDFADEMRGQLAGGRRELGEFDTAVAHLVRQIDGMQSVDQGLAAECAKLLPAVPDQLADAAQSLQQQQQRLAVVVQSSETIAHAIRTRIGEALGAIQIGDSARQRIEHVAFACEQMAGLDGLEEPAARAGRAHLAALCIAHIDAIDSDFGTDARRLMSTLENLLPDTSRLLDSTRNERSVSDSSALIGRVESGIAECVDLTGHLTRANADVAAILAAVLETIDSLTTRVERVQDLGIEVGYMSVNANLRCRTNQAISRPVAVIAREIKSHSRLIDEVSGKFVAMSEALTALSEDIAGTGQVGGLDVRAALEASLLSLRETAERTTQGIAKVETNCGGIADRLQLAAEDLRESMAIVGSLAAVRAELATLAAGRDNEALEDPEHPVRAMLERIRAVYTMAQERVIHERFVLPGMAATAPAAAVSAGSGAASLAEDDDDDALFDDALF